MDELTAWNGRLAVVFGLMLVVAAAMDAATAVSFVRGREYRFYGAAMSIRQIVRSDAGHPALMLGVSGSQLSLMTGIPSINDAYGTEDMAHKLRKYQPGWCVVWNDQVNPVTESLFRMEKVASYPVFDDDDRNLLILYRLTLK